MYGAVVAMMFPIMILLFLLERYKKYRVITAIMIAVLAMGIIFSYGRAAWISLLIAFAVSLIYLLRLKATFVFSAATLVLLIAGVFWTDIIDKLEKNEQDSTSENLGEHVQSITNISTDASNLERINRWNSAIEMFRRKPIIGWGPGTYAFQYADDITIISTNAGDGGNAHSEFIGPLAEEGLLGGLTFIIILIVFYYRASLLYFRLPKGELRTIVFFIILAFTSYIINGTLNNFLDMDKASVPFWAFIAMIVAIDLNSKKFLAIETELLEK